MKAPDKPADPARAPHFYAAPGIKSPKGSPCARCGRKSDDPIHMRPR